MKACVIYDKEYQTLLFEQLIKEINSYLKEKDFQIEEIPIGRNDITFCKGCFGCWNKKPGECVITDRMSWINKTVMSSDVYIMLSPIVLGQYSANIKNVMDRSLHIALPFVKSSKDRSTYHPVRYKSCPKWIVIGYADELSADDIRNFTKIVRYINDVPEVLILQGSDTNLGKMLDKYQLKRMEVVL